MGIRVAETDAEIDTCYAVMRQLRPHLDREGFRRRVRAQQRAGYQLAWLAARGRTDAHRFYQREGFAIVSYELERGV